MNDLAGHGVGYPSDGRDGHDARWRYLVEQAAGVPDIVANPEIRWRAVELKIMPAVRASINESGMPPDFRFDMTHLPEGEVYRLVPEIVAHFPLSLEQGAFDRYFAGQTNRDRAVAVAITEQQVHHHGLAHVIYNGLLDLMDTLVEKQPFDEGTGLYGRR